MPKILLLTSAAGDGPVSGSPGDVLDVPADLARVWCDGERAERWENSKRQHAYRAELGHDGGV